MAVKKFREGLGLDPQSSDPASPFEGQFQYSDGTHRTKGLWEYRGTEWVNIGDSTASVTNYSAEEGANYTVGLTDGIIDISNIDTYNANRFVYLPDAVDSEGKTFLIRRSNAYIQDASYAFDSATDISTATDTFDLDGTSSELVTGMGVQITTTGTLPAPLVVSTTYYVYVDPGDSDLIHLCTTYANAIIGTYITLTSTGSGTQSIDHSLGRYIGVLSTSPSQSWNLYGEFDSITVYSTGDEYILINKQRNELDDNIFFETGNGHGSSNTKIRRYSNLRNHTGSSLSYTDSSAFGTKVTANQEGIYNITFSDAYSGGSTFVGPVLDSAVGTTSAGSVTYAQGRRGGGTTSANGVATSFSWSGYLSAGTIIVIQTNGTPDSTTDLVFFSVTKVG